jgi:hypothetical protein
LGEEDKLAESAASFFRGKKVGGREVGGGGGLVFPIEGAVEKDV